MGGEASPLLKSTSMAMSGARAGSSPAFAVGRPWEMPLCPPPPKLGTSALQGGCLWELLGWWGRAEPSQPPGFPPQAVTPGDGRCEGGLEPARGMGSAHSSFRQTQKVGVDFFF